MNSESGNIMKIISKYVEKYLKTRDQIGYRQQGQWLNNLNSIEMGTEDDTDEI